MGWRASDQQLIELDACLDYRHSIGKQLLHHVWPHETVNVILYSINLILFSINVNLITR